VDWILRRFGARFDVIGISLAETRFSSGSRARRRAARAAPSRRACGAGARLRRLSPATAWAYLGPQRYHAHVPATLKPKSLASSSASRAVSTKRSCAAAHFPRIRQPVHRPMHVFRDVDDTDIQRERPWLEHIRGRRW